MPNKIDINGNVYGVVNAQDGSNIHQNLILPKHKVPKQLTSELGKDTIIGREKELKEIDELLNSSNSLLLINGIGGIGKSTIASYYLHSQKDKLDYYGFFEGIDSFLTELRSRLDIKAEKEQEAFMEALTKLSALEGNKLLVIDDVKNIEENQDKIDKILALKNSGYKILLTSRQEIEDITRYELDVLSMDDAKKLFNSIYEVEDEVLLEEILNYLDCHAFFVEMTAKTLKSKKTLTPELIKEKFENGEFSTIKRKRKESFNDYLDDLFSFDELDDEEILMLKQLSVLPSIKIEFKFLQEIFDKKDDEEFEETLNYLCEKGWLSSFENGYKLHQIVKEYIVYFHLPTFGNIKPLFDILHSYIEDSANTQVAITTQKYLIYYESLNSLLKKIDIKLLAKLKKLQWSQPSKPLTLRDLNYQWTEFCKKFILDKNIILYYLRLGNIYQKLDFNKKALSFFKLSLTLSHKLEEENNLADIYNGLANCYYSLGKYKESIEYDIKSIGIRVLNEESYILLAHGYSHLASSCNQLEDRENASKFFEKSLQLIEYTENTEIENSKKIEIYNLSANFYVDENKFERALELLLKCKKLHDKNPIASDIASTNFNLANIYLELKNYEESEKLYLQTLKIKKQSYGENHSEIATSYLGLAKFYLQIKQLDKASSYNHQASKIVDNAVDKNDSVIASSYQISGSIYSQKKEYLKAITEYFNALKIVKKINNNSQDTAICYKDISTVYYNSGNPNKALIFVKKSINILEKNKEELYFEVLKLRDTINDYLIAK